MQPKHRRRNLKNRRRSPLGGRLPPIQQPDRSKRHAWQTWEARARGLRGPDVAGQPLCELLTRAGSPNQDPLKAIRSSKGSPTRFREVLSLGLGRWKKRQRRDLLVWRDFKVDLLLQNHSTRARPQRELAGDPRPPHGASRLLGRGTALDTVRRLWPVIRSPGF